MEQLHIGLGTGCHKNHLSAALRCVIYFVQIQQIESVKFVRI